MTGLNVGKAPKNSAVLPFYGGAAFFFLVWSILLLLTFTTSVPHYFNNHILSIVHLAALGWGTMIIFGAAYQLLPVICENNLYSSRLAFISFLFLSSGVVLLSTSFWFFWLGWMMITGGSLILVAALLYFVNVIQTAQIRFHSSWERLFVFSSSLWLLFTIIVGVLLAINLRYSFFSSNHLEILKLHAHAGLAGWFLQLITGISIKLIPMFLLGKSNKTNLLKWSFILQNSGLILFLTDGYFFGGVSERSLIYGLLIVIGIILWFIYIIDVLKKRIKKKIDDSMRHTFVSLICLAIAIILIPILYYSVSIKWVFIYGLFLFAGWISSIILGMTFKTLPFIVWNDRYKKLNGLAKIPLPRNLFNEKLLKYQFWIYISSLYIIALSLIFEQDITLKIGLALWLVVAIIYCINVIKVLTHKTTILS